MFLTNIRETAHHPKAWEFGQLNESHQDTHGEILKALEMFQSAIKNEPQETIVRKRILILSIHW